MTPLPKNKITRAERGKRRKGNTPKLLVQAKQKKIPLHKDKMAQKIAILLNPVKKANEKEQKKKLMAKMAGKKSKK